ncbi:MmcQ/YjbR family DNA-binding protein [Hwangdonia seohaensis]|uniref:MmcQ/YjbR family DNA-binding protein n=1 Tax=Hwangdonia seohaensis TaxID=1240727 RepID=A0ABW3R7E9_9FLAO|nr:MmcQ/YjbR family DNA-binding protein [Hwangdonia seohaensis]
MNIEQLRNYCLSKKGTSEGFPFDDNVLVFKVLGKMFVLTGLQSWEKGEAAINLKADPDYSEELRTEFSSIRPGYHMSKKHWNTVYIDEGELETKLVLKLIDHSYEMVVKTLPKKLRDNLV